MVINLEKFWVPFTLKSRGESLLVKCSTKGFLVSCYNIILISLDKPLSQCYIVITMKDTYIRIRISSAQKELWQKEAEEKDITMTDLIIDALEESVGVITENDVITEEKEESVITEDSVMTEEVDEVLKELDESEVTLEDLQEEVEEALQLSDGENWRRVKELLKGAGYEWDGRTRAIYKDGRVVYRAKGD
jgi:uncharacterized protein (DUF1778 family)